MNQIKLLILLVALSFLYSCNSTKEQKNKPSPRVKSLSKIVEPRNGLRQTIGDTIQFKISSNNSEVTIDSVEILNEGRIVADNQQIWVTNAENPGKHNLTVSVYLSNGTTEKKRHSVTLLSDIEPLRYTYRITNTYPHDPDAFTEGLFIENGQLFESTGEKGQSTLRKVDLESGKVLKSIDLASQYFGEGIAPFDNYIYMLSWKERTGFVFDKNSFEQIRQFTYPTEGWGMTTNGKELIMSDGTYIIRFMEPESFSENRQIKVYDQNGPVDFLNELEYINGDLFAVRWQTEMVYIIDPESGKVKGILDLEGIFDYSLYDRRIDVLNGIAYNEKTDRYYITGKWWPKLFEIQLVAANNI